MLDHLVEGDSTRLVMIYQQGHVDVDTFKKDALDYFCIHHDENNYDDFDPDGVDDIELWFNTEMVPGFLKRSVNHGYLHIAEVDPDEDIHDYDFIEHWISGKVNDNPVTYVDVWDL